MDQKSAQRLDSHRLQRTFNKRAAAFDNHGWLHREVGNRLLEHLVPVSIEPRGILDLGSATGELGRALSRRFKSARVVSLDFARQMLFQARTKAPRWFNRQSFVCADAQRLSLADNCLQLACSNLVLPWVEDVQRVLSETHRVLDSGGLLMLSNFGPQTLIELRQAFYQVDQAAHINAFMDMHDLGDVMTQVGFRDVVVDAERVTINYKSFSALLKDVQAIGAGNANQGRRSGLMGRDGLEKLEMAYESFREGGRYLVSFELIFAHGWKQAPMKGPVEVAWRKGRG